MDQSFIIDYYGDLWGNGCNKNEHLGLSGVPHTSDFVKISTPSPIKSVYIGFYHTILLDDDGKMIILGGKKNLDELFKNEAKLLSVNVCDIWVLTKTNEILRYNIFSSDKSYFSYGIHEDVLGLNFIQVQKKYPKRISLTTNNTSNWV